MVIHVLLLVLGLVLLAGGAEALVRGAASLAQRAGLTPLSIGLTVVAFGTSAPELVVSVSSSLGGHGDIAVGNVVGSNIFNVAVILALTALICPMRIALGVLKIDAPFMVAVSLVGAGLIARGPIPRPAGALLVLTLAAYTGYSLWLARRQATDPITQEFAEGTPGRSSSLFLDVALIGAGLALLVVGSRLLVDASLVIAQRFGISEAVVGLTIAAAGTSMPELATSLVAALRGRSDIAVGNIVGSNVFNLLGILGTAALVAPIQAPGISRLDLAMMVGVAVALLPMMWTGQRLQRGEAALLLGSYGVYLWLLWPQA